MIANLVIARVTTRMSSQKASVDLQLARFGIRIGSILLAIVVLVILGEALTSVLRKKVI